MFLGSSESLDLRFGVTSADFDACAKQFNVNKGLIMLVMTVTLADTLSCHGTLFDGIMLGNLFNVLFCHSVKLKFIHIVEIVCDWLHLPD